MSADPYIQAPDMLQSYNRYAYVMNNPLNLTDPSGYWSFRSIFRTVVAIAIAVYAPQFISSYLAQAAGAAAAAGLTGATAVGAYAAGYAAAYGAVSTAIISGAAAGFASALVSSGGDVRAAAVGALSGGLFAGVGASFSAGSTGSYLGHAATGCITSVAGGGACGSGAVSAVFGKFSSNHINFGNVVANGIAATVAGGAGAVIAGGKFQNGAVTAAYGYLFNELQHGRGTMRQRLQSAGYAETSYSDGSYCNIQGGNGSCGHAGAVSNDQTQAGASGGFTAAALLGASMDVGPVKSTDGSCAVMRNVCVIGGPIFGATVDTTLLNVSAGSPSDGWSISFINKAAIPVGGYSIAPGYGSDGLTLQAGRSFGTMLGWGVKTCIQTKGGSCAGN